MTNIDLKNEIKKLQETIKKGKTQLVQGLLRIEELDAQIQRNREKIEANQKSGQSMSHSNPS
jgi:predicted  nucleic acid-binding Zn-ribbon protein